jgi:23S rRNA (pseudouridine1915-N3)-methyltransferase
VLVEIADARGKPEQSKRQEALALLNALPDRALLVALDQGGVELDTSGFAAAVGRWSAGRRPLCFVIGGADGLDAMVLNQADVVLSLGRMTWPHRLVRVMLAEQIFRARAIATGHPYHRAARPDAQPEGAPEEAP